MLKIRDLERRLQELPLLPTVVARLMTLSVDDKDYFDKVLELTEQDPPFALRIIKICNSASNAPVNPITNLRSAIVRLGTREISSLVTSMAVTRVFIPSTPAGRGLWIHSIQTAVASRLIARQSTTLQVDHEQAYLCGLLHDIGRFVLFQGASEVLEAVDEANWTTPKQLVDVEQEIYGFDHSELGWRVCNIWALPATISTVVKNHHVYQLPDQLAGEPTLSSLIRIIQTADFFSVFIILNPDAANWEPAKLIDSLAEKCIHPACSTPPVTAGELQSLAPQIIKKSDEILAQLGI